MERSTMELRFKNNHELLKEDKYNREAVALWIEDNMNQIHEVV